MKTLIPRDLCCLKSALQSAFKITTLRFKVDEKVTATHNLVTQETRSLFAWIKHGK